MISVTLGEPPVAKINSPTNGTIFVEGQIIYFDGEALDHEDGDLTGSSLIWNSSVNGLIGTGEYFSTTSLSVGIHNITFTATDSSGVSDAKNITITVEESTPIVNITFPANNSEFYYLQNNVSFKADASDPHQGNNSKESV